MSQATQTDRSTAGERRPRLSRRFAAGVLILPRTQVLRRQLVLPTCDRKETEHILRYRMPLETPFMIDEIAWTWRVVQALSNGSYLVRVTIVEKKKLRRYLDENGVGSRIRGILVEDEFLALWQDMASASGASAPEIQVYRLPGRLLANLTMSGECLRSEARQVDEASEPDRTDRELVEILQAGCQRDGMAFEAGIGSAVDVPLSESGMNGSAAVARLQADGWLLDLKRLADRKLAARLRDAAHRELLPAAWQAMARGRRRVVELLAAATCCLLLAFGGSLASNQLSRSVRDSRLEADAARAQLHDDLEQVQAAQHLITSIEAWSGKSRRVLEAWHQVSAAIPQSVSLTGLTIQENGRLAIQGSAESRANVVNFMDALRIYEGSVLKDIVLAGLEERAGKQVFHIAAQIKENGGQRSP